MKTLLLLRHAKSSWKDPERSDHDRPLNKRGKRDAPRMGQLVASRPVIPDVVVSSTAKRARRTASAVVAELTTPIDVVLDRRLYLASPAEIIDVVREVGGSADCMMIVGHNPGLEDLVARLTGTTEPMATAALADIRLDIDEWSELKLSEGARLEGLWRPRELPD